MEKNILIASSCTTRGNTGGLTSILIDTLLLNRDFIKIDLLDISFERKEDPNVFHADRYYSVTNNAIVRLLLKIPRIRRIIRERFVKRKIEKLVERKNYDLFIIYELPIFVDAMVRSAHMNNIKVLLYPWGSDVLRANQFKLCRLKTAIRESEFIGGYHNSGTINYILQNFSLSKEKLILFNVAIPGIKEIEKVENKVTRSEMSRGLDIPICERNIVCGYNGVAGQRHKEIIESICRIKSKLPEDYQLIFPITYGNSQAYYKEIKDLCYKNHLRAVFIENYLTSQQMAYLHLITDLFINVQPTDNGNAFLMEALFANNAIITGKWLNYPQFERYGIPYYQCETIDTLHLCIEEVINNNFKSIVPKKVISDLGSCTPEQLKEDWRGFLNQI